MTSQTILSTDLAQRIVALEATLRGLPRTVWGTVTQAEPSISVLVDGFDTPVEEVVTEMGRVTVGERVKMSAQGTSYTIVGVSGDARNERVDQIESDVGDVGDALDVVESQVSVIEADLLVEKGRVQQALDDAFEAKGGVAGALASVAELDDRVTPEIVSAQTKADEAAIDALLARGEALDAWERAGVAIEDAATADGKAVAAQAAANSAQSKADKAESDAAAAQSKANTAASDLLTLAGKTGRVIRSASAPTGEDRSQNNLWLNTGTGQLAEWTGSKWQVITDSRLTAASDAADQAANLAGNAQSQADLAKSLADAAALAADAADGKAVAAGTAASNAASAAASAQSTADTAKADAATAQSAADQAKADATSKSAAAESAAKTYAAAQASAAEAAAKAAASSDATAKANAAKAAAEATAAADALAKANAAQAAAEAKAATAQTAANNAQSQADLAKSLADAAEAKAATAQAAADAAKQVAENALWALPNLVTKAPYSQSGWTLREDGTFVRSTNGGDALYFTGINVKPGQVIRLTATWEREGEAGDFLCGLIPRFLNGSIIPGNGWTPTDKERWAGSQGYSSLFPTRTRDYEIPEDVDYVAFGAWVNNNAAREPVALTSVVIQDVTEIVRLDASIDAVEVEALAARSEAAAAQSTADTAKTNAATAQTKANKAESDAAAAATAAATANTAAANAAGIANSKAVVLYQTSAPAAEYRNALTLWIDTTGGNNTPKRWSSGTTWVAVTDKAATDAANAAAAANTAATNAASAAAAAQSTANTAKSDAAAAQTKANKAEADALLAQNAADAAGAKATTADGRYTVATANPTAANAAGKPLGAVWEVRSGSTSLRRYVLTAATTWTQVKAGQDFIGAKAIGQAQIGDAAIGTLQVANAAITDAKIGDLTVGKLTATQSAKFNSAVIDALVGDSAYWQKMHVEGAITVGGPNKVGSVLIADGAITAPKITASQALSAKVAQFLEVETGKITWDNAAGNNAFIGSLVGNDAFLQKLMTNRLIVSGDNLIPDPTFQTLTVARGAGSGWDTGVAGSGAIYVRYQGAGAAWLDVMGTRSGGADPSTNWVACEGGAQYVLTWRSYKSGFPSWRWQVNYERANGTRDWMTGPTYTAAGSSSVTQTWEFTIPVDAVRFSVRAYILNPDSVAGTWSIYGQDLSLRKRVGAVLIEDGAVLAEKLAARIVLASEIIAGDSDGTYAVMNPQGFHVLRAQPEGEGDPAQLVQLGVADEGDYLTVADDHGYPLASIADDGMLAGSGLQVSGAAAAESFVMDGEDPATWVSNLSMKPVVAVTITASEVGTNTSTYIRGGAERRIALLSWTNQDTEPHQVWIPPIPTTVSANGTGTLIMRWRYSTEQVADATSTTISTTAVTLAATGYMQAALPAVSREVGPGETLSLAFTGSTSSTGYRFAYNVRIQLFDLGRTLDVEGDWRISSLWREDASGNNVAAGPGAISPKKGQVTKTFDISPELDSQRARYYVNYSPPERDLGVNLGFQYDNNAHTSISASIIPPAVRTDIMSALSGADIIKIEVYVYFYYWSRSSGGTFGLNTHTFSTMPTAANHPSTSTVVKGKTARPGGVWVTLPISKHAGFQSGATKGFVYTGVPGSADSGNIDDYYLKLRVTYVPPSDTA